LAIRLQKLSSEESDRLVKKYSTESRLWDGHNNA
jgi:hypothetical protein